MLAPLRSIALAVLLVAASATAASSAPRGLRGFIAKHAPSVGHQRYLFGRVRAPRFVDKIAQRLGFSGGSRRRVLHVDNARLDAFVKATSGRYLEVMVPRNRGHVYFRYRGKVYDFYPEGFRVGGVRPIGGERYGMLVPLTKAQEKKIAAYVKRLERTGGKELGTYDFSGENGFHCVSWMMRLALGRRGENLLKTLGSQKKGMGMASFARFMLKKAAPVEAVVVYSNDKLTPKQLDTHSFQIMSRRALRQAHGAETIARTEGTGH